MQKTLLIGHLGNDPELRDAQGKSVCTFSLVTTERWKDQQGNRQEKTEWHRIVAWNQLAQTCVNHLAKGSRVFIEGKNKTRKWIDQNGVDHYVTEIIAREMEMLGTPDHGSIQPGCGDPLSSCQEDVPF